MNLFNQFSYPILVIVALVGTVLFMRQLLRARWLYITPVIAAIGASALLIFLVLRPVGDTPANADDVSRILANGRPTFLEFFSSYCSGCIALKPLVDQLVIDIEPDFNILRIDIHTPAGREIRRRFTFSFTPEFVLFNPQGVEVFRNHLPPGSADLEAARQS